MTAPLLMLKPLFPIIVREPRQDIRGYVVIRDDHDGRELFIIGNGDIEIRSNNSGLKSWFVQLRHSFATDVEGDPVYLANFEMKGLELRGAGGYSVTFVGMLTAAKFYPPGHRDAEGSLTNPFLKLKSSRDLDEDEEYPYLPPPVIFGDRLRMPLDVSITLYHRGDDYTLAWFEELEREQRTDN